MTSSAVGSVQTWRWLERWTVLAIFMIFCQKKTGLSCHLVHHTCCASMRGPQNTAQRKNQSMQCKNPKVHLQASHCKGKFAQFFLCKFYFSRKVQWRSSPILSSKMPKTGTPILTVTSSLFYPSLSFQSKHLDKREQNMLTQSRPIIPRMTIS